MKQKWNFLQKLGFLLLLASLLLLIGSELLNLRTQTRTAQFTEQILSRLPPPTEGDPVNYSNSVMPVLQSHGTDFVGLIEVPAYGIRLPIGSSWNQHTIPLYPCRFWGSAYDNSLIIGGSNKIGQFHFCTNLDLGEKIIFTDMEGTQFSYAVVRIDRREHADMVSFQSADADLTLFSRDTISGDYVIVRCLLSH